MIAPENAGIKINVYPYYLFYIIVVVALKKGVATKNLFIHANELALVILGLFSE